jgi:hypothetical protein
MDPETLKAALEALKNDDKDAALAILEQMIAALATGGAAAAEPDAGAALAEGADPATPAADPNATEELTAVLSALRALVPGSASAAEAVVALGAMRKQVQTLDSERATLELAERRGYIADLIKLGLETPGFAWEGKAEDRKPCKRLMAEPIADMRVRVEALRKLHKETPRIPRRGDPSSDPAAAGGVVRPLTARQREQLKKLGLSEEQFRERCASAVVTREIVTA